MYVCMYVCMYVLYVCMYVCMYACMYVCMYPFPATMLISFVTSIVDLERFLVFMKISYWSELEPSELIGVGPAPETNETGPSLFFEPVTCKLIQGLVWGAFESRAGLTSYRSHANGILKRDIGMARFI